MSKIEDFLSQEEETAIVNAIKSAENKTSGEIRVHIEKDCKKDLFERALEVFHSLKMDNTQLRNGVLIYVAVNDRKFLIYGDQGINNVVPHDFWETTKNTIQEYFKKGEFKDGIISGILNTGNELKKYFPWESSDINELSDDISKG